MQYRLFITVFRVWQMHIRRHVQQITVVIS